MLKLIFLLFTVKVVAGANLVVILHDLLDDHCSMLESYKCISSFCSFILE